jgi:hypothetical protein
MTIFDFEKYDIQLEELPVPKRWDLFSKQSRQYKSLEKRRLESLAKIATHTGELSPKKKEQYPLLSNFDFPHFTELNSALIAGAARIADLTQTRIAELNKNIERTIFSIPFTIHPKGYEFERANPDQYFVEIQLPLPPGQASTEESYLSCKFFVKHCATKEAANSNHSIYRALKRTGSLNHELLYRHENILFINHGDEGRTMVDDLK